MNPNKAPSPDGMNTCFFPEILAYIGKRCQQGNLSLLAPKYNAF